MRYVHKLFFWRAYTTGQNKNYWLGKTDPKYWREYQKTWNHPHRFIISAALKQLEWYSLFEIGCGSGPNIINIVKNHQNKQIGGADINPTAIQILGETLKGGIFRVSSGEDIMMSDKSTDVTLSDMYLIYVDPLKIRKHLREIKRITRKYAIFYEFHSPKFWDRMNLRIFSGRHAYDYKKLLEKVGFYDIQVFKIPKIEEDNEKKYRHLIIAKTPLRI